MRIFICDDIDTRIELVKKRFPNDIIVAAMHYDHAMPILLSEEKFDVFMLDHDLESYYTNPVTFEKYEKTGTDLVKEIIEKLPKEKYPDQTICHSWNEEGRKRMGRLLKEAGFKRVSCQKFDMNATR